MNFKLWLERIEVPYYLPHIMWKETLEKAEKLEASMKGFSETAKQCYKLCREYNLNLYRVFSELPSTFKQLEEYPYYFLSRAMHDYTTMYASADSHVKEILMNNLDPITYHNWNFKQFIQAYSDYFRRNREFQEELDQLDNDEKHVFLDMKHHLDAFLEYIKLLKSFGRHIRSYKERKEGQPAHKPFEVLYHATAFTREILSQGFKTQSEVEKLGLGGATTGSNLAEEGISFTADFKIAKAVAIALRDAIKIAIGKMKLTDVIALLESENIDKKYWSDLAKDNPTDIFELYKIYLSHSNLRYDPMFFGVRIENFIGLDESNVSIIACRCDMSKVIKYAQAMEEFRVQKDGIQILKSIPISH